MSGTNPHFELWTEQLVKRTEEFTGGTSIADQIAYLESKAERNATAQDDDEALQVLKEVKRLINTRLQQGRWCATAGKPVHSLIKVAVFALENVVQILEKKAA